MRISTRARYALRLMIDLASREQEGTPVILREIAERQQLSKRYLEQLATSLKNANLLTTAQGRGGGYTLARPAEDIAVRDIIAATIGDINVVPCVLCPDRCARSEACPSREMWVQVNEAVEAVFARVSLADLRESSANEASTAGDTVACREA
jgi:Rrf2 family protein